MKNTQHLNVWTTFALNHIYKDINSDALKTLDALMFLSPPDKMTFKESFLFSLDIGLDVISEGRSPVKIQKETNYNFSDFLVLKLIENFRRVYAIESNLNKENKSLLYKNRGFDLDSSQLIDHKINPSKIGSLSDNKKNDLNNLEQQQKNIYSTIDKLKNCLHFKDNLTVYPKAIIGKNYETTIFEMCCYLGVHQSLKSENVHIHKSFVEAMNSSFSISNININNIQLFNKLYYPYERRLFVQMYMDKIPALKLVENHLSFNVDKPSDFYKITLIDLLGQKKSVNLLNEQKIELLVDLFIHSFFKYFSPSEKTKFEEKIDNLFSDIDYEVLFRKQVMSPSRASSLEYKFVIKRVKSFFDEQLFLKSFCKNLSTADKEQLIGLFDLDDQNLLKRVVDILAEKSNGSQQLAEVLPYFSCINKEAIAYIVAKNSDFFPVVQPYYLMEKLTPVLNYKNGNDIINTPKKI